MRYAKLTPDLPMSIFPQQTQRQEQHYKAPLEVLDKAAGSESHWMRNQESSAHQSIQNDDFADDEIDDHDLIAAGWFFFQASGFLLTYVSGFNNLQKLRRVQSRYDNRKAFAKPRIASVGSTGTNPRSLQANYECLETDTTREREVGM